MAATDREGFNRKGSAIYSNADDASQNMVATDREGYLNKSAVYSKAGDGSQHLSATPRQGFEGKSGVFSNNENVTERMAATPLEGVPGRESADFSHPDVASNNLAATPLAGHPGEQSAVYSKDDGGSQRNLDATDIDAHPDQKSAAFGDLSSIDQRGSQQDFIDKSQANFSNVTPLEKRGEEEEHNMAVREPEMDQDGRSDESEEGVVVDHAPFKGIQEAMANQDKLRGNLKPPTESESEEVKEENKRRRIKQVLYSDKSESSVDDMMEDTPSNYNIANGRLEGKSMGLKAILLFAKNQGI
jgi:hypothetical protein